MKEIAVKCQDVDLLKERQDNFKNYENFENKNFKTERGKLVTQDKELKCPRNRKKIGKIRKELHDFQVVLKERQNDAILEGCGYGGVLSREIILTNLPLQKISVPAGPYCHTGPPGFPLLRESHKKSHLFGVLMKQKK